MITPPSAFLLDERVFLTLGILRVAACLERDGYSVEMLDLSGVANYVAAVLAHVEHSVAGVFGITATTPQMPATAKIVAALREQTCSRIILGGPHATLVHAAARRERKLGIAGRGQKSLEQLIQMFDVLVVGDGEDAIFEALRPNPTKIVDGDDPHANLFMTNKRLGEMPLPARHLVDVSSYHYTIEGAPALSMIAQLGCPFRLQFLRGARVGHAPANPHAEYGQRRR